MGQVRTNEEGTGALRLGLEIEPNGVKLGLEIEPNGFRSDGLEIEPNG